MNLMKFSLKPYFYKLVWSERPWVIPTLIPEPVCVISLRPIPKKTKQPKPISLPQVEELLADDASKGWSHYPSNNRPLCHACTF